MKISIFLSYPKPIHARQAKFVETLSTVLEDRGFKPRTLGVTDYDMTAPLTSIRRLMIESSGLITIAFRRAFIERGSARHQTDIAGGQALPLDGRWLTSPWPHIEVAMAYQLGLPVMILREKGVLEEGVLERAVVGLYMPELDLDLPPETYFKSMEWNGVFLRWDGYAKQVAERKGQPPRLFGSSD